MKEQKSYLSILRKIVEEFLITIAIGVAVLLIVIWFLLLGWIIVIRDTKVILEKG